MGGLALLLMLASETASANPNLPTHCKGEKAIGSMSHKLVCSETGYKSKTLLRPCSYYYDSRKDWIKPTAFRQTQMPNGSFPGLEMINTRIHTPLSFQNDPAFPPEARPVLSFNIFPLLDYTDSSIDSDEGNTTRVNDETANKLLKILQSAVHDKYLPFKNQNAQPIHPTSPEIQYHVLRVSCLVFLWYQFNSLISTYH